MTHSRHAVRPPLAAILLLLSLFAPTIPLHAQGCSQCRETVGQTSPRTQQAYRRGILVLIIAGLSVCTAALVLARRFR